MLYRNYRFLFTRSRFQITQVAEALSYLHSLSFIYGHVCAVSLSAKPIVLSLMQQRRQMFL